MINALKHRTKEACIKLSNELDGLSDKDIKSSFIKLYMMLNKHAQELREINQDVNRYKDDYS